MYMIGWSFGLVLENVGGEGRSAGGVPGARVARLHLDDRVVHGGQVVHRELQVGKGAEQDHRGGQHRGGHRSPYKRFGEVHEAPPVVLAGGSAASEEGSAKRTSPPGVAAIWPVTTTRSPTSRPRLRTANSPW